MFRESMISPESKVKSSMLKLPQEGFGHNALAQMRGDKSARERIALVQDFMVAVAVMLVRQDVRIRDMAVGIGSPSAAD
jgi:hypothetical protein